MDIANAISDDLFRELNTAIFDGLHVELRDGIYFGLCNELYVGLCYKLFNEHRTISIDSEINVTLRTKLRNRL